MSYLQDVAIIGAGLGGCALALALSAHNIPVRVYESRHPDSEVLKSGIVLTPNGLWVLDQLGVFGRIKDRCYKARYRVFKNDKYETTQKILTADEAQYGYCNHRIWRKLLLVEMRQMLSERSVQINYNSKFNGIVSDDNNEVTFRINNDELHATLLIGSDGVHSAVRQHIAPGIVPEYTGVIGVLSHIKTASVDWPEEGEHEHNATIQDKPGALFFIAEDPKGEEIMIGRQIQHPEQTREDLDKLQTDYDKLIHFYRKDYDEWGPTSKSIIDAITENKESCYIWPFVRMPTLPQWFTSTGRIIIVGDGAHAIPPSSGQGLCQALEDVYSLTLLLTSIVPLNRATKGMNDNASENKPTDARLLAGLRSWQEMRQERIDELVDYVNHTVNVSRMSESERQKLIAEGKVKEKKATGEGDMSWLYKPKLEQDMKQRLSRLT